MDMDVQSLAATAGRMLATLSQDTRLIEIDTALADALVVERFAGSESVCADFKFEIDCLSTSAFLDAKTLIGQPLALRLRQADGSHRHWHGHCTQVAPLGSDGGLARYRLRMEPWTAFLRLRRNAIIFQDLDALGVIERIFDDYPQAAYRVDATQSLPVWATRTQYRQNDHDFVFGLLADAGLAWRFEHAQAAADGESEPCHTLVIFDRDTELADGEPATLRFHRADAAEASDAITHFTEQRQATANAVTAASWQPGRVESHAAALDAVPAGPNLPTREVYRADRSNHFAERSHAGQAADLQLDALRLPQRLHAGSGSARGLGAGAGFTLSWHPDLSGQRFIPLAIEHVAANNLPSGIVALLDSSATANGELERGSYRNRFVAVPTETAIVPLPRAKPTAPGPQTARVVGLPDAAVTSNREHQVRIQFAWQRGRAPNRGGLTDTGSTANPEGHAPGDDSSGSWVRVAEWQAGPNWGSHAVPRIGSEVLVEFLHGDIDQPLIVGQLYNGEVAPPFALAEASNHPGTVSGLHTQSLDGSGSQQWLMDDATGQLRQRLHTTLADSRLELGYLIDANDASRSGYQGEGFDLATLGWANVRAGQGLLLSTTARSNATSTQLDIAEAVAQLQGAERTAQALSDAAQGSEVAALAGNARQTDFITRIDPEQDGKYSGSVNGQSATRPSGTVRDGGDPVEKFAQPVLLAESSDAIAFTTPASAIAYAGGHSHLTSQQDAHIAAGHTFAGVSGGHVALFAQHGPIKAIAANGPLSLQAHAGPLELLADQGVTVTATDERIDVLAKQKIVLQAGKTQITLEGGDITFACPGNFTVKAGQVPFKGGADNAATLVALPNAVARNAPEAKFDASYAGVSGETGTAGVKAVSPPALKSRCCDLRLSDYEETDYEVFLSGDYDLCDASGNRILVGGNPMPLNYANSGGRFALKYLSGESRIQATVRIRVHPKDWHELDAIGGAIKIDPVSGGAISWPYDADQARKVRRGTIPLREVRRSAAGRGLAALSGKVEAVLNQDSYKLINTQCAAGAACSNRIDVELVVEFVEDGASHEEVNIFPAASRADSGNLGEINVRPNSVAGGPTWTAITPEHVAAHEGGHWFGWPDEYFENGGAVHHRYIKSDRTIDVAMAEPADDWKRASPGNLMGRGVYKMHADTPAYYFNHLKDWFVEKTGQPWGIVK